MPICGPATDIEPDVFLDDRKLAEIAFPGAIPICLDSFMYRSREQYPLPWLVREIVQNFVDANKDHPGTLDGVEVKEEEIGGKARRFTITGNWLFRKPGALTTFGTDKHLVVGEGNTKAGGNGIGLKQTGLRFLRDLGVTRFVVIGEGWEVEYWMASSGVVSQRLREMGRSESVDQGLMMANQRTSSNSGKCRYIIETANSAVCKELRNFKNMGVCDANNSLKGVPDYKHPAGSFWLHGVDGEGEAATAKKGRLFINGQIHRFDNGRGDGNERDYWSGPSGITIAMTIGDFKMTMDRPPMNGYDLVGYVDWFVEKMSRDQLIDFLKKAEHIWSKFRNNPNDSRMPFVMRVVEKVVETLSRWQFTSADYKNLVGEKKYLCLDMDLPAERIRAFEEEGYIICGSFFGGIYMPKASTRVEDIDLARQRSPDIAGMDAKLFEDSKRGIRVPFERLSKMSAEELGQHVRAKLGDIINRIETNGSRVTIFLKTNWKYYHLVNQEDPPSVVTYLPIHKLYVIRGIIHAGLGSNIFSKACVAQGEYLMTCAVHDQSLVIRNNRASSDEPFLEMELEELYLSEFVKALQRVGLSRMVAKITNVIPSISRSGQTERSHGGILAGIGRVTGVTAAVGGAVCAALLAIEAYGESYLHNAAIEEQAGIGNELDRWRDSKNEQPNFKMPFVGDRGIADIIHRQNETSVGIDWKKEFARGLDSLKGLGELIDGSAKSGSEVDPSIVEEFTVANFHITDKPTESQLRRLYLLKEYFYLTTGHNPDNALFIYSGDGAYGINAGQIGIHENLLEADFEEAVSTFSHEVGHNASMAHGYQFIVVTDALASEREDSLGNIARTPEDSREPWQSRVLAIELEWDTLRGAE